MADKFSASIRTPVPSGMDMWAVLDAARERMSSALVEVTGFVVEDDVWVTASDDSRIQRATVEEARAAAHEYDFEIRHVWQSLDALSPDAHPVAAPETSVQLWLMRVAAAPELHIDIQAKSPLVRDGLAGAATRFAKRVEAGSPVLPTNIPGAPSADAGQADPFEEPVRDTPAEPGWLKRTWRDHTAAFIVTVLGTIAAAIIVANLGLPG